MTAIPEEAVEALASVLLSRVNAPEQEVYRAVREGIAAALPHLQQGQGWRTMESAPHETHVLLFIPQTHYSPPSMEVGFAKGGQRFANGYSNAWEHGYATHWMPLPPAPDGREG